MNSHQSRILSVLFSLVVVSGCSTMEGGSVVREEFFTQVQSTPGFGPYDINVESFRDVIYIDGSVVSETSRDRASAIAASLQGVRQVENRLIINPSLSGGAALLPEVGHVARA